MINHPMNGHEALCRLMAGNQKFYEGRLEIRPTREAVLALRDGQNPFAAIVACADSRVPPELVLGCSLGDLFVVRTAGNVVSDFELGSIEYAVDALQVPLVLVLGHSDCGAVAGAIDPACSAGALDTIRAEIAPSVQRAKSETTDPEQIAPLAENYNILHTVQKLKTAAAWDAALTPLIVGAKYNVDTGKITVLTD